MLHIFHSSNFTYVESMENIILAKSEKGNVNSEEKINPQIQAASEGSMKSVSDHWENIRKREGIICSLYT